MFILHVSVLHLSVNVKLTGAPQPLKVIPILLKLLVDMRNCCRQPAQTIRITSTGSTCYPGVHLWRPSYHNSITTLFCLKIAQIPTRKTTRWCGEATCNTYILRNPMTAGDPVPDVGLPGAPRCETFTSGWPGSNGMQSDYHDIQRSNLHRRRAHR